jgi:hypothetical protein
MVTIPLNYMTAKRMRRWTFLSFWHEGLIAHILGPAENENPDFCIHFVDLSLRHGTGRIEMGTDHA